MSSYLNALALRLSTIAGPDIAYAIAEVVQMAIGRLGSAAILAAAIAVPASAQQPTFHIEGDNITITGCLARVTADPALASSTIVWSRGDIMLAAAAAAGAPVPSPVGTTGVQERIFYWLDDEDDLAKYVGQRVVITGDVEDFEKGKVEIEREDDMVEIELTLRDDREEIRLPVSWFGTAVSKDEKEFDIIARRIDVDEVRVVGTCAAQ
jgi:hypothetical protein